MHLKINIKIMFILDFEGKEKDPFRQYSSELTGHSLRGEFKSIG